MTEIIDEVMPGHPAGVLTGPNLAREIHGGHEEAARLGSAAAEGNGEVTSGIWVSG